MTGWQTFLLGLFGTGSVGGSGMLAFRVWWKGRTRRPSSAEAFRTELETFKTSASAEMAALKAEMAAEKRERRTEFQQMSAALQAFRDRDGLWLELWHGQNVALSSAGLPVVQLPDRLRQWPEEITVATTGSKP